MKSNSKRSEKVSPRQHFRLVFDVVVVVIISGTAGSGSASHLLHIQLRLFMKIPSEITVFKKTLKSTGFKISAAV